MSEEEANVEREAKMTGELANPTIGQRERVTTIRDDSNVHVNSPATTSQQQRRPNSPPATTHQQQRRPTIREDLTEVVENIKVSLLGKSIMFFITLIIFFAGIALIAAAAYAITQINELDDEFQKILNTYPELLYGVYCILICGVILAFIGFCGCCGSVCENNTMLGFFFLCLCVVFATQLIAFFFAVSKVTEVEEAFRRSMDYVYVVWVDPSSSIPDLIHYVHNLKEPNNTQLQFTAAWLSVQGHYKCCGYDSPTDWHTIHLVPPYAAYCTEDGLQNLVNNTAAMSKASKDPQKLLDYIKELSQKESFKDPCRTVFVETALMVSIVSTAMLCVELGVLFVCLYLMYQIRRKHKAQKKGISETAR